VRRSGEVAGAKVVNERVAALLDGDRLEKRGRVLGTEFLGVLGHLVELQCSANVARKNGGRKNVTSGPRRLGSGREGDRDGDGCGGAGGSAAQSTADDPLEVNHGKASAHSVHVQHAGGVSANDSAEEVGHHLVRPLEWGHDVVDDAQLFVAQLGEEEHQFAAARTGVRGNVVVHLPNGRVPPSTADKVRNVFGEGFDPIANHHHGVHEVDHSGVDGAENLLRVGSGKVPVKFPAKVGNVGGPLGKAAHKSAYLRVVTLLTRAFPKVFQIGPGDQISFVIVGVPGEVHFWVLLVNESKGCVYWKYLCY
jgi:hypothetical protein